MKKSLFFLLSFLLLFALPYTVQAHKHSKFIQQYEQLDDEKKHQVDEILDSLHEELDKLGVKIPHPNVHKMLSQLDEAKKEQVKTIMKQLKDGAITSDEAEAKLKELGVTLPEKEGLCKIIDGLDEETKKQVKEILKAKKDGSITHEEAKKKLKELGVELPDPIQLDDATKKKAKQLVEQAEKEFEKIGIDFPIEKYKRFIE